MEKKSEQMRIKQGIKLKITPVSLVPIATGAAFLILGTKSMDSCPCKFFIMSTEFNKNISD